MTKQSLDSGGRNKTAKIPNHIKFIISGISGCCSTTVCHPIDLVKNRMQLSGEGGVARAHKTSFHAVIDIANNEGLKSFYYGFSANIARQLSYTTIRLGTYQVAVDKFNNMGKSGFRAQINASLISGFIAAILATPTDVALIRMTADNRLPPSERRNYKHVFDAISRMYREEGVEGLWAGAIPSVLRAMAGNVTQIVSYVQAKHFLTDNDYMRDGVMCHFVASVASGLIYAFFTVPLDVAKTRMQTMKIIGGKAEYSSMVQVFIRIHKTEGFFAFWKGFAPYYFKIAPNTILLFVINEHLTHAYKKHILQDLTAKGGF